EEVSKLTPCDKSIGFTYRRWPRRTWHLYFSVLFSTPKECRITVCCFTSLGPHGHAGQSSCHTATVFEPHKDPIRFRNKWNISDGCHKNSKGRCLVGKDRGGDAGCRWR